MSSSSPTIAGFKQYACTDVQAWHFTFEWVIKNFKLLPEENGEFLSSPNFHAKENNEVKWKLNLYPRGAEADVLDHLSLYLYLDSYKAGRIRIKVHCELSILRAESVVWKDSFIHTYDKRMGQGYDSVIRRSKILDSSGSNDSITIRCTVDIPQQTVTKSLEPVPLDLQKGQLSEHFSHLLKHSQFCDVTIIVGNEKLTAHKVVLAARSPVFTAMFEHKGMDENRKNKVKIEDMEPATVRGMLEFIYTDKVTDLKTLAPELLRASDKYELDRLRIMCEEVIYETITTDNAAEMLVLSDLYRSHNLKEYIMGFIDGHLPGVTKSKSFKSLVGTHPVLLGELMCSMGTQRE